MSKPFTAYEPIPVRSTKPGEPYRHIIGHRVVPEYRPQSAIADAFGWVYHKFALHATKGWRKV